jgi:hypothetical protein
MSPTRRDRPLRKLTLVLLGLLAVLPACRCNVRRSSDGISVGGPATSSGGFGVMAAGGPEVWTVDGKPFQIRATYFVVVNGRLQFTADYMCAQRCPEFVGMTEEKAFAVAYPVMKHAVTHDLFERARIQKVGSEPLKTELIGVAITQQAGDGKENGYRVSRTLDQVRAAIQASGPAGQDVRP